MVPVRANYGPMIRTVSAPKTTPKKVTIKVLLDPDLIAAIDDLRAEYRDSRPQLIRRLIIDAVKANAR